jgi:protein DJ-1
MSEKRVLVLLAPGAEEMETVIVVDVLRRAQLEVVLAGLDGPDPVTCSRRVRLVPDCALPDARGPFDLIVLPGGGEGSKRLARDPAVAALLRDQEARGRWIGAICAAPSALAAHRIGKGRAMTSHPSVRDTVAAHAAYREERVVADGKIVTSRGPGTAVEFALALVEKLLGAPAAQAVRAPMVVA